jgi:hypothetical protein
MYCELLRTDMMVQYKDGMTALIQTDHRSAADIMSEGEDLSKAFAIARVLTAIRRGRQENVDPFKVIYTMGEQPPPSIHMVIASAGGFLAIDTNEVAYPRQPPDLLPLMNGAMLNVARAVSEREGVPLTIEGLQDLERKYHQRGLDQEEDLIEFWTSVVELGAFAGELMRGMTGGGWNTTDIEMMFPMVFECGPLVMNPLDKSIKLLTQGMDDSVAFMVRAARDNYAQLGQPGRAPPPTQRGAMAEIAGASHQQALQAKKRKGLFGRRS